MEVSKTNTLSFYNDQGVLTISAKQYDTGRKFIFNIINDYELCDLTGYSVYLRMKKADKTEFQGDECCTIDGSKVIVDTSVGNGDQILSCSGMNLCELHLIDGDGKTITTWNFIINVESRVHNGDGILSKDSWDIMYTIDSKAPIASPKFKGIPTAPTASAGTNTRQIATTAFVQTAVSNGIAASDALIFKGTLGKTGTITALPTTYKIGWTYRVVTNGTYAGQVCEIGDLVIALVNRKDMGNLDSDWCVVQTNLTVDDALSSTSTNPVQNKVVNSALDRKITSGTSLFDEYIYKSSVQDIYIKSYQSPFNITNTVDTTHKLGDVIKSHDNVLAGIIANLNALPFDDSTSTYSTLSDANTAAETSIGKIKNKVGIIDFLKNAKQSFSAIIQGLKFLNISVGAISGITDSLTATSSNIALSAKGGSNLQDQINTMKSNFQGGVDTIYNAFVNAGTTPSAKTPAAIQNAVTTLQNNSYNSGITQGENNVKNNPNSYSLYTLDQYNNSYNSGRTQGQNDVKNSPNSYGLYTSSQYNNSYNNGYSAGYNNGYSAGSNKSVSIETIFDSSSSSNTITVSKSYKAIIMFGKGSGSFTVFANGSTMTNNFVSNSINSNSIITVSVNIPAGAELRSNAPGGGGSKPEFVGVYGIN